MYDWIGKKRRGANIIEDEVTSCVFGPLRIMEPKHAWASGLILLGLQDEFPVFEPTRVDVKFWPRFKKEDEQGFFVEPDVHIIAWVDRKVVATILVEVKWYASLGDNQLLDQWRLISVDGYEREKLRSCSRHIFLSTRPFRDAETIRKQKDEADKYGIGWADRLIVRSWHHVAAHLKDGTGQQGMLDAGLNDLLCFLSSQGIVAFDGFRRSLFTNTNRVEWRFNEFRKPKLLPPGPLNWSFDDNGAAA